MTVPKNARDRSQQVNRSPHFNFQKQHRPQQEVNTYSPHRILNRYPQHSLLQCLPKYRYCRGLHQRQHSQQHLVVDEQQPGTSRQLMFTLSLTKTVNPPSVAASQQEESQYNTSGLSSLFGMIPSVLQYHQIDTPQPFSPSQLQPVPSSTHQEPSRPLS